MSPWTPFDILLFAAAAYVAVFALLKLVAARRETLLRELEQDIAREQKTAKKS
ncbi:MAG: hypothetical protein SFX18_07735 [Pirellulales bacterium]|nr:hypothetical protein [Pirellulales bacterium]